MAEITRERTGTLIRTVLEVLMENPEGLQARDVLAEVERRVELTPFEDSHYPSNPNIRRFTRIVRFSTITLVKAGWMLKNRGEWSITDAGIEAYRTYPDPAEFMREASRLYRKWKKDQVDESDDSDDEISDSPGPAATLEEAEESAWTGIETHLREIGPYDFQELVAGLLRGMGYHVTWVAPAGPDRGIDVVAYSDPLGVEGRCIKVQVKRRVDRIPVGDVRSFLAVLGDSDVGVFVASGGFTKDAEAEARMQERRQIMLLDAKKLFDLWVEHYDKVPERQRRLLPLRPVYYLAPEE